MNFTVAMGVRASPEQFATIIEFMETYGDLARPHQGSLGRARSEKLWQDLAALLNSARDCGQRSTEKWKKVWADWKTKTKKKALNMHLRPSHSRTLNCLEQRVLALIAKTAGDAPSDAQEQNYNMNAVSVEQICALIEFLENEPVMAFGNGARSKEGRVKAKKFWRDVAAILNSVSADGCFKEPAGWRLVSTHELKTLRIRSNKSQLRLLVDHMSQNEDLALGTYPPNPMGSARHHRDWEALRKKLNQFGPQKTVLQWQLSWRDLKKKAREQYVRVMSNCSGENSPMLSDVNAKIISIIGTDKITLKDADESGVQESVEAKPVRVTGAVFTRVKQACIELVKNNVCEASLFDDESFRSILQLLPMTSKEKAKITAEYIQKYVDMNPDDEEAENSVQDDANASDDDEPESSERRDQSNRVVIVKAEIEEVPSCQCNAGTADDSSNCHVMGCPAAAKQPYWNYFEVTTDEATCQICNLTLSWTNITKLKDHLLEKHPTAEFVDDGKEFSRGPASDIWSHDDTDEVRQETEEVYLDDFDFKETAQPSSRKRRRTSEPSKEKPDGLGTSKYQKGTKEEKKGVDWRKEGKREENEELSEADKKMIRLAPDRFKSLDSFGQYVADLMKLLPRKKCLKYQVQIVQRLLQEQAAAG